MDSAFDQNLVARLLLTLVTAFYGLGLVIADVNKTHVTNPIWTPHARFHAVWQIGSYTGLGLIALFLLWTRGPLYVERLYLVACFAIVILVSFFFAFGTMKLYGGLNYDLNGHLPKDLRIAGTSLKLDANTTVFSVLTLLLICSVLAISR